MGDDIYKKKSKDFLRFGYSAVFFDFFFVNFSISISVPPINIIGIKNKPHNISNTFSSFTIIQSPSVGLLNYEKRALLILLGTLMH
ncbi:MAG: hypothetical protein K0S34_2118 [Bacillales bacterium]|nr:hypothetical protein [Bacillales bacterium]